MSESSRWEWDNLSATVPWKVNGRAPSLYERNRIRLPYMVWYNTTSCEFFYVNRDYKQLGVRQSECSWQEHPPIEGSHHYFYSDGNAPRTPTTTKKLLQTIRDFEQSHLAGFTERTDFGPLDKRTGGL